MNGAAKIKEYISRNLGGFPFKVRGDSKQIEATLREHLAKAVKDGNIKLCEGIFSLLERKKWAEKGFEREKFTVAEEVLYGFNYERRVTQAIRGLQIYAVRDNLILQADIKVFKPGATVWAEVKVPWYFSDDCPREKFSKLRFIADKYNDVVAGIIYELAKKHGVNVGNLWHRINIYSRPRRNFARAVRRLACFLSEYSYEKVRDKAIEALEKMAEERRKRSRKTTSQKKAVNLTLTRFMQG